MKIGNRPIGLQHPPYVIAEIGVNHDGEVARALELTDAAAEAGADAVKLQYFETDRLMSKAAKLAAYQKAAGETDPIAMLRRLELTLDEMALVVERAHARGIHAIVTVFSTELVESAETLAWDAYKTASPDLVNLPLQKALATTGKPLIVSTGASNLEELELVEALHSRVSDLAYLHCVSSYPTPRERASIGGMWDIMEQVRYWQGPEVYGLGPICGYSDHTTELDTGALAVRLGGCILEKHLTYSNLAAGPDHAASLEPIEMADYVRHCRAAERPSIQREVTYHLSGFFKRKAVERCWSTLEHDEAVVLAASDVRYGELKKEVLDCERDVRTVSRQSVVSVGSIAAGTVIGRQHLTIKRPGTGILAYRLDEVIGRTAARDIEADVPILEEDLA